MIPGIFIQIVIVVVLAALALWITPQLTSDPIINKVVRVVVVVLLVLYLLWLLVGFAGGMPAPVFRRG